MDDRSNHDAFLGRGWSFPPVFSKQEAGVLLNSGVDDIRESLQILLSTRLKERLMRPEYGCNLDRLLFEPLDSSLITYVKDLITTAILYYEPRIDPEEVHIQAQLDDPNQIEISIQYTVRSTNSRFNYVFPFYKMEGTQLDL